MKLYGFQPQGHGELSFFTIAESEDEARIAVDKYISKNGLGNIIIDDYKLTIVERGDVIENDND